jgi:hypothetical protein
MKVEMISEPGVLKLIFNLEDDDRPEPSEKYRMVGNIVTTKLPEDLDIERIHPDLLALCCIMIAEPFIGTKIYLPKPVSKKFYEGHSSVTSRYKIGNVDENLRPWMPAKNSVPGLAFSGGVDSTAALSLLPHSTIPIFLDRPLKGKSAYNKDAAINSCLELRRLQYNVQMIECDLEYIREPVGFPVDVVNSVPGILLADYLKLDSIAFGTIMEASYRIGHKLYKDYPRGNHYRHWGGIFSAAGIPINYPVAGISEIGTSIIVDKSPIGYVAQSCMRGVWKEPCRNCWKCFRKMILDAAITKQTFDAAALNDIFDNKEALRFIRSIPIKHENVLTWATNRLDINHELFSLLKKRVEGDTKSHHWMSKWYSDSIEIVHEKYREIFRDNVSRYLDVMSENDVLEMRKWSMAELIDSKNTEKDRDALVSLMERHIRSR